MTNETPIVPTVGEIARRHNTTIHRVEYAIRAYDIQPVGWAGNARVFSEEAVRRIGEILGAEPAETHERTDREEVAP